MSSTAFLCKGVLCCLHNVVHRFRTVGVTPLRFSVFPFHQIGLSPYIGYHKSPYHLSIVIQVRPILGGALLVFTKGQSFLFIYFILCGSQTFTQFLAIYCVNDPFLFPTNSKRLRQNVRTSDPFLFLCLSPSIYSCNCSRSVWSIRHSVNASTVNDIEMHFGGLFLRR